MMSYALRCLRRMFFFLPDPVVQSLYFEALSFIGRLKSRPLVLATNTRSYINLGSGPRIVKGFINIDFFTTSGIEYGADLRYALKIGENTVDGVFCEHTLEHLSYHDGRNLLGECYRILKPGGVIRIVVPDLSLFMTHYCTQDQKWFDEWERLMFITSTDEKRKKRRLHTPLEAISFITQEYGHVSCWDFPTIRHYLGISGFREITQYSFMQGRCKELLIDLDGEDRKFVSLYVEAVK